MKKGTLQSVLFILTMALTTTIIFTISTEVPRLFPKQRILHTIESLILGFLAGVVGYTIAFYLLKREHIPL